MAEISEYIYIYIYVYIYIHMDTYIYIYIFKVDKGIEFTVLQKTKKNISWMLLNYYLFEIRSDWRSPVNGNSRES